MLRRRFTEEGVPLVCWPLWLVSLPAQQQSLSGQPLQCRWPSASINFPTEHAEPRPRPELSALCSTGSCHRVHEAVPVAFSRACACSADENSLLRPDPAKLPGQAQAFNMAELWEIIHSQRDLNLPAHKVLLRPHYCHMPCAAVYNKQGLLLHACMALRPSTDQTHEARQEPVSGLTCPESSKGANSCRPGQLWV